MKIKNYHFDLIVTSRDRSYKFERFLKGVQDQDAKITRRILFADQNSGNYFPESLDGSLSYEKVKISKTSISCARNMVIALGLSSEIVCFPDDDCWYGPNTLLQVKTVFDSNPSLDVLCVNVCDPATNTNLGRRPRGSVQRVNYHNLFSLPISVGIFMRTSVFREFGVRFNEKLGAGTDLGSGEETELIYRLLNSGKKILYNGSISVFHEVNKEINDYKKMRYYGKGYGYLISKIFLNGHYIVIKDYFRTICGAFIAVFIFIPKRFKLLGYLNRLYGIFMGTLLAIKDKVSEGV